MGNPQRHVEDFLGVYAQRVDEKRRIVLPVEWRETIVARNPPEDRGLIYLILRQLHSISPCIDAYDAKGYELARKDVPSYMWFRRTVGNNRFVIPEQLATNAEIMPGQSCVLEAPDQTHMRIWSEERWKKWDAVRDKLEHKP